MRFAALVTLLLVLASSAVIAQENELTYGEHQQKAAEAYRNQDYSLFVQHTASAIDINPHSLVSWYNLACGYALTGQTEGAFRVLRGLAEDGIDFGAANDSDVDVSAHVDITALPFVREILPITMTSVGCAIGRCSHRKLAEGTIDHKGPIRALRTTGG